MKENRFLANGFLNSVKRYPDNNAVYVGNRFIKYRELYNLSIRIAATIQQYSLNSGSKLTAVFAYRSMSAFSGILGALLTGHGYVPLNRTFPTNRTKLMLVRSECKSIVLDTESAKQLHNVIDGIPYPLLLIFPDLNDVTDFSNKWPMHKIIGENDLEKSDNWQLPSPDINDIAYLLFTSGSTGIPKGVMVAHRNVIPFIEYMVNRYKITEKDRFSQMFDTTFDLSVFDMFVAWEKGACVCCPSQKTLIKPGKFIKDLELTVWFSVPSTAIFMKRFKMLKPNSYPTLRWSLFCGEALSMESVQTWTLAAPNSTLENLYGPTELTISCTLYRWDPQRSPNDCEIGVVPIGYLYPNMNALVVDEKLKEVSEGEVGELLMNGPQMTLGYWKDPEKTATAFIIPPGKDEVFYRTGDRVRKPKGDGPLTHLGRTDSQVKIHGHRVELGEVEAIVREESRIDAVVAVGWPETTSGYGGIQLFLECEGIDTQGLFNKVSCRLPDYMTPSKYHTIQKIPLNINGKFDRNALRKVLESKI